jgi:hypothetical protein
MLNSGKSDAGFIALAETASQSGTNEEIHISLDRHLRAKQVRSGQYRG